MIYNVLFPRLGISMQINPIAFTIGFVHIHWYGIIIALGFSLAFFYVSRRSSHFGFKETEIEKFTIIISVVAIIFARIYYVIFYPGDFYLKNPYKIFFISEGGIAIYGAVIGGLLTLYVISKLHRKNFGALLDLISLGVLIGQAVGRWGNFFNQEAFGSHTDLPWGMSSENTFGDTVHPCFFYESLGCFACFIFLHFYSLNRKHKPGKIFFIYMFFYGLIRSLIEELRTDSLLIPYTSIKVSQFFSVLITLISFFVICTKYSKREEQ